MSRSSCLQFLQVLTSLSLLSVVLSEQGPDWEQLNDEELQDAINNQRNTGVAKNVVLFIGDGMGPNTVTASRIYDRGEKGTLCFEKFPHLGLLKTYSANSQVPESAATATALMCGEKTNAETLGISSRVQSQDCAGSLKPENRLKSIAHWAQVAGKSTGIVTTTRVTHATPAGMYAHSASRNWECESKMPPNATRCKDIARQLIEDLPGRNLNVILGGGRQVMVTDFQSTPKESLDPGRCRRKDGRDLIKDWSYDKENRGAPHEYVTNAEELHNVDYSKTEYLLGIFADSHMPFESDRDKSPKGPPSLMEMTQAAINTLVKNNKGFILMVEGGLIDLAHHLTLTRKALDETVEFNKAINSTVQLLKHLKMLDETLIIVTSDHSHTLTINGYPKLGNSILGIAQRSKLDGAPFTTLSYGTVGPGGYQYYVSPDGTSVVREDPSKVDTKSYDYQFQGAILSDNNHHGGADVLVYARGPMAHLFHRVHEQSYVAKVITYAAAIGPDSKRSKSIAVSLESTISLVFMITFVILLKVLR